MVPQIFVATVNFPASHCSFNRQPLVGIGIFFFFQQKKKGEPLQNDWVALSVLVNLRCL